jgi:hypothetical protein
VDQEQSAIATAWTTKPENRVSAFTTKPVSASTTSRVVVFLQIRFWDPAPNRPWRSLAALDRFVAEKAQIANNRHIDHRK